MLQAAIFLIFLITIISTILVLSINTFTTFQQTIVVQKDKNEILYTKTQIINKIRYVDNHKLVPLGVNGTQYHELPNWLLINRNNAFGIPYMYCPYSTNNTLTADDTILLDNENSYEIETKNSEETNNKNYVLASDPAPIDNVLSFIVSFRESTSYNCNDISFVNNKFQLPDVSAGRVEAITNDNILASDIKKVEMHNIEQSNDTLNETLLKWNTIQPERFVITLKSGDTFNIENDIVFNNEQQGIQKEIYISGNNSLSKSDITNIDKKTLSFSNVTLILKNINFSGEYSFILDNVNLYTENSILKNITAENSKITFNNTNVESNSIESSDISLGINTSNVLNLYNSELIFKNSSINNFTSYNDKEVLISANNSKISGNNITINYKTTGQANVIEGINSEIYFSSSNLILNKISGNPNSMFYIDSGSTLSIYNSYIQQVLSYSFLQNYGKTNINQTTITMGNNSLSAIVLNRGSKLEMNNSSIVDNGKSGGKPVTGITDLGGLYIGGDNNSIYASSACTQGDLFEKIEKITVEDDTIASVNSDFSINPIANNDEVELNIRDYFNKFSYFCL